MVKFYNGEVIINHQIWNLEVAYFQTNPVVWNLEGDFCSLYLQRRFLGCSIGHFECVSADFLDFSHLSNKT